MVLSITKPEQAPLVKSSHYLFYGKVEVTMKASPGVGIITSIVLESDTRDEIDWVRRNRYFFFLKMREWNNSGPMDWLLM